MVCPRVRESRFRTGQQAPQPPSPLRAALYGGAAALGGCAIYALVAIVLKAEIGLIAILVGYMVGKAIRHASHGRGGRPQQILAVLFTYFAITTSYIAVFVYHAVSDAKAKAIVTAATSRTGLTPAPIEPRRTRRRSVWQAH